MDSAEYWSADLKDGTINTFNTLVHELGHTLGLFHIDDFDNIMAPFYNGIREAEVDLGPLDIQKLQSLYGVRKCECESNSQFSTSQVDAIDSSQFMAFKNESSTLLFLPLRTSPCLVLQSPCPAL